MNKTDNSDYEKIDKTQISNIRNKMGVMNTNITDFKRMKKGVL